MPLKSRRMIDYNDPRVCKIGHPAPAWLINYADLMTELVCFFIILYALSAALNKDIQDAKQQLESMIKEGTVAGEVKVTKDGMKITFQEAGDVVFFETGQSDLSAEMREILAKVIPTIKELSEKFDILVEGHTDNVPIHNQKYRSNWELSTERATEVVHYLITEHGLSPARLAAVGYGEHKPTASNDTPEDRARNRRIVFFVKTLTSKIDKKRP
ncbi:MAG: flagellar motor protein MotB [Elusimicrobiota bacterium]